MKNLSKEETKKKRRKRIEKREKLSKNFLKVKEEKTIKNKY